jgi:outer membrane protein assembly factor BamE (lipoprotein component of BamABCDE complex)
MKNHLALLALAAALAAGCSETINTTGQVILPSRLSQIQPGTTTREEVVQLLGSPSASGTMNDNRWYYITSIEGTKAFQPHNLKSRRVIIVDFDSSNTVAGLTEKTEADSKALDPDRKATPTHGQSLGVLDQLFGNLGLGTAK